MNRGPDLRVLRLKHENDYLKARVLRLEALLERCRRWMMSRRVTKRHRTEQFALQDEITTTLGRRPRARTLVVLGRTDGREEVQ